MPTSSQVTLVVGLLSIQIGSEARQNTEAWPRARLKSLMLNAARMVINKKDLVCRMMPDAFGPSSNLKHA